MNPIDFDAAFADYAHKWAHERMKVEKNLDAVEAEMPDLYRKWLKRPQAFLGGVSPEEYFARYETPGALIDLMKEYQAAGVAIPDPLMERLDDMGEHAISPLTALAADEEADLALRMTALNLLIELQAEEPMELCLRITDRREKEDELADVAAELLSALGEKAVPKMLSRLETASDAALDTYLDLLCNFPGDERIYTMTVERFLRLDDRRSLYANFLAKLGDERALKPLSRVLALSDIGYLDYLEVRNAIEALGGDAPLGDRSFDGDAAYEALKNMN
jgi:hypothetical protein